jgi:hypothetical protein
MWAGRSAVTIDEARKLLEEAEATWALRPWDRERQRQVKAARAELARVQREAERHGQVRLDFEEPGK